MTTMKHAALVATTLLAINGCDPDPSGIKGVTAPTGFAVTHTDYNAAAAIALLSPEGELEQARFVHSGTVFEGLGAALSSDVVLPTTPGAPGTLTYLERLGVNAVTTIDIASGQVVSQIEARAERSGTYQSNPYDYLRIDDSQAWVTRYAANLDATEGDVDSGNDLFLLDLENAEAGDERISFDAMNTKADVTNPDTNETTEVDVYARPARMVRVGDHVLVGLDRISLAFDAIGSGMLAIVDLNAKSATAFPLTGLSNCGSVSPVADDPSRVVVSCLGSFVADPREEAGIAILHVQDGDVTVEHRWNARDHETDPLAVSNVVSLGGTRVVAVATGDFATTGDQAMALDVESGELSVVGESDGSYVLGNGAYNAASRTLLLPDASTDENGVSIGGIRRFQWSDAGDVTELDMVQTDPDLSPRAVSALR